MSDFIHQFWSNYVAIISLVSIFACALLLWLTARKRVASSADNTTGHVWDEDLREANNPLPMWWVGLFVLTILFGLGYLAVFPGLGSFKGQYGWSSKSEYEADAAKATQELALVYAKYAAMPVEEIAKDPQARAIGERLFMNNCSQCHGSDARGSKGFPNLTDKDWLHGGTPEKIAETITKGRVGVMPPMAAAVGTPNDVKNLANYVLSLSGEPSDSVRAGLGKSKFTACAACHGIGGVGNQTMGAPALNDKVWLHGYGEAAIIQMINAGKHNEMPAQEGRLTEEQIRMLASYVWGFSNSGAAPATP
ncbi:cytochrome c oxidase cbb3-type subunit 3 [Variovorax boronicumulans]|uniref:cytochrome-c oxidase, cbb3-type subunit III n=1 Tax=Variovorax boronicumulans TaxID=436515 RepID=UPI002784904C|nr:cytochrome-c oxidase, cbb3-type subunit III [Variovorax boronicumulans]MDQ0036842.1 cytochrome c oxidase cbb3-type subunit 3 [Variovorax boronicumulans]